MPPFLCGCPNTGQTVQGLAARKTPDEAYELVSCLACLQLHFVNPTTDSVLGEDDEYAVSVS